MIEIAFVGQSYNMDSLDISSQRSVNMYPEVYKDGNAKTVMSLRTTHGLLEFATQTGVNQNRGMHLTATNRLFSVQGNDVAEFSTAGTETARFTLDSGVSPADNAIVKMCDNGVNVLFTDGTAGYVYNLSTDTATKISTQVSGDGDAFPDSATHCAILDGFYIVNVPSTTLCYYSSVDNPLVWSTLSSLSKEGSSDFVNSLIVSNRRLWVFGSQSYEVFYNTGDSNNQFLRMEGTYHNIGCQAPYSVAENGVSVFWLGSNAQGFGQIFRSNGFDPMPISTRPIETAIHGYSTTSDAEGFCFQQEGNEFYQLTFPTEGVTWVYDLGTGMWHEKTYFNQTTGNEERHRGRTQVFFNGKNYMGDWNNGKIYEVSTTTYTDDGAPIIRTRISPVVWNALERVYYDSIEFDIESGTGLVTGQGKTPQIMVSWSNDSGHTYGTEVWVGAGKIGEYRKRAKINRLGAARNRVFKVQYSEPTPFNIFNLHAEFG